MRAIKHEDERDIEGLLLLFASCLRRLGGLLFTYQLGLYPHETLPRYGGRFRVSVSSLLHPQEILAAPKASGA